MSDFATGQTRRSVDDSTGALDRIERVSRREGSSVQAKLAVGSATDPLEREADLVAHIVVDSLANSLQLRRSSKVQRVENGLQDRGGAVGSSPATRVRRATVTVPPVRSEPDPRIQRSAVPAPSTASLPMAVSIDRGQTIRRVMSSDDFKDSDAYTTADEAVRAHLAEFLTLLESYETLAVASLPASIRRHLLTALSGSFSIIWDDMEDGREFVEVIEDSAMSDLLTALETELEEDDATLSEEEENELGKKDFTSDNEARSKESKVGGALNKLDEVKYNFGLDAGGQRTKDVTGMFASYFKEEKEVDDQFGQHRGQYHGIPKDKPQFGNRSLAMYQLDQLLNASLVPPTFRASRQGRIGIAMEKVSGRKDLNDDENRNVLDGKSATEAELSQPKVREALSNLSMLDYIAGQVDRHPGNYLIIKQPDGTINVRAIDNDLSFGVNYLDVVDGMEDAGDEVRSQVTAGVLPANLQEIDSDFAKRIIALASLSEAITEALFGLLSSAEIEATKARLLKLADFLRPLVTSNDPRIVTQWA